MLEAQLHWMLHQLWIYNNAVFHEDSIQMVMSAIKGKFFTRPLPLPTKNE